MHDSSNDLTLITGGTGKTGRRIVERMRARGIPVRVGSRAGTPPFDWQEPATWAPALRGASAAYVSFYPDVAMPGASETVGAFAQVAVEQGARRLVLLSARGEDEAQPAERAVQDSGVEWTVVRCSWFSQNFSEGFLREPVLAGELAIPAGPVGEPFVDADDIADVAVAALTEPGHAGQVYEVTGPRLLTFPEAVDEIARASRRPVRFTRVPVEAFTSALTREGVAPEDASLFAHLFTDLLDGRNAHLGDGVQRALGRAPRDFSDYARTAATAGAWAG
jgi:uncharacterized protein YbjT (DUF2867 family)